MVRPDLENLPEAPLPEGVSLRWYEPGDEAVWTDLWQRSDPLHGVGPNTFEENFGEARDELPRRMCFLIDEAGKAIGTATAWLPDEAHPDSGRVHWVAIVPEAQGRGLARPLMAACLHRMKELGYRKSFLTSESPRLVAIGLYWRLGYRPEIPSDADREIWQTITRHLGVDMP